MNTKETISKYLCNVLEGVSSDDILKIIENPPNISMGDIALPCFGFAKMLHKNPAIIALEIKELLDENKDELGISKVENIGGYCNIFLDRAKHVKSIIEHMKLDNMGVKKVGKNKTICMDYSSPNIAKNFHVGHLRTTIIGNSLYKIHKKLGYNVVRINHLGDWGTQFGKLIVAYKNWSNKEEVERKGIEELLRIYVKFNCEVEDKPELIDEARKWFIKMEQNDAEALTIWEWFKDISMAEFQRVYNMLGVSFDSYNGESFYRDKVPNLVNILKDKNLLEESEGANVINLDKYNMPPCLITKSDGGSIYHSRDIAAILYRKEKYNFDKCLYVTGSEQSLHFKQVFKAVELMGYDWTDDLVHIPYGLVSLDGAKLSTRSGNIIYAEDILQEAIKRAMNAIQVKNPNLEDSKDVAKNVGIGAVIFHDLFNQRIKNVDFSWDEVLSFEGTTGPYVQYTYARAKSILRKANYKDEHSEGKVQEDIDYSLLVDDSAYLLIKRLSEYEDAINNAAKYYEPSIIARYVISLATEFNKFYHECSIIKEEEKIKQARLALVEIVSKVIKESCELLGIKCPEKM